MCEFFRGIAGLGLALREYKYIYKTDVKSYYASVDIFLLFDILFGLQIAQARQAFLGKRRYLLSTP